MRFPVAIAASVFSIALYFALFWGFDALRILTSPTFGLEDAWRSQIVYWIGRSLGLGPQGLLNLAAAFAALKLTAAGVCAAHIADRVRCFKGGKPDADIIEIGLLLVVIVSILSVLPAMWQQDASLIRTNTLNLVLASVAAALSIIERSEKMAPAFTAEAVTDEQAINKPAIDMQAMNTPAINMPAIAEPQPVKVRAWYSPWR